MSSQFWKVGLSLVGVAAAVAAGVAVSLGEEKPKEPAAAPTAKWSTIKGRVVWPGAAPKAVAINVTADKEHCLGKGALESDEIVVNAKSGGFKNVWVYLRPDDDDKNAKFKADEIHPALMKPKAKEHEVDQPCCQFVPRILAVREGDSINFKNSSPIPHNVKFSSDGLEFNQTLAAGGGFKSGEIKAQRNPIPFACNIHPWMMGKAMVFDHPYYAVTDADGKFEIKNAPVGKYRIVYRSETVFHKGKDGNLGFPIEIKAATTELDPLKFEVPPKTH